LQLLSFIQLRGEGSRQPEALARTLLANLPQLVDSLENGLPMRNDDGLHTDLAPAPPVVSRVAPPRS
jgi:hypothetical protein